MKKMIFLFIAAATLTLCGCNKKETITCTILWQLQTQAQPETYAPIEKAFQDTFFGYYQRLNDNTVRAENTTQSDVRSLTLKLSSMADQKITPDSLPPDHPPIQISVFINFHNSYTEEVWSKTY